MAEPKEYIERGAALLAITGQPSELHYPSWYKGNIMEIPAADVVEVVRCKDCKYYEEVEYYPNGTKRVCRTLKRQLQPDDFCSYGERKEE